MAKINPSQTICIWSDYNWCLLSEIEQYTWKSDDYAMLFFDPDFDEPQAIVDRFLELF